MEHIDSLDRFVTPYSKPRGLTVVQSKFKALQAKLISTVASCASWMYFFTLPYSAGRNAYHIHTNSTRSSADADSRLDAFSGQSRSTNMVPFHMLHIVSYCAIVTLSLRHSPKTIFVFKKFHNLEMGVKSHSRSLRVVSFDRLCMVSY